MGSDRRRSALSRPRGLLSVACLRSSCLRAASRSPTRFQRPERGAAAATRSRQGAGRALGASLHTAFGPRGSERDVLWLLPPSLPGGSPQMPARRPASEELATTDTVQGQTMPCVHPCGRVSLSSWGKPKRTTGTARLTIIGPQVGHVKSPTQGDVKIYGLACPTHQGGLSRPRSVPKCREHPNPYSPGCPAVEAEGAPRRLQAISGHG